MNVLDKVDLLFFYMNATYGCSCSDATS